MTTTASKRPTHRAYFVQGEGDNKTWYELGPVWAHKDGDGFTIQASVLPAPGQAITVRKIKPKDDKKTPDAHTDIPE